MKRRTLSLAVVAALALGAASASRGADDTPDRVEVVAQRDLQRVDVRIGGTPFTSYLYGTSLNGRTTVRKPVLFPLRSARGTTVTRGYPLEPRPGERADHPHHVGHWFNHGDVNGFDFWGFSDETPAALRAKTGTIVHTGVVRATSGAGQGALGVTADWMAADGARLLAETTEFVFRGGAGWRAIDRTTRWQAVKGPVVFGDTKEGSFGIRVASALEHPAGQYLASDGAAGEGVWGSRGPWMALTGVVGSEPLTIAIFDHPKNPGAPTHWHARGYGLFAANPFGRQGFDPKQEKSPTTLPAGGALSFRHRILIRTGKATRGELQQEYERFLATQS